MNVVLFCCFAYVIHGGVYWTRADTNEREKERESKRKKMRVDPNLRNAGKILSEQFGHEKT